VSRIERVAFAVTTGATGSGSAVSPYPIEGSILEWIAPVASTALTGVGATASFTATRREDGGTVLALTPQGAPWRYAPRRLVVTEAGGTTFLVAGSATSGVLDTQGIPSADYVTLAVTGAGSAASGTVYMLYDRHRA
jgi:hypothetical protein